MNSKTYQERLMKANVKPDTINSYGWTIQFHATLVKLGFKTGWGHIEGLTGGTNLYRDILYFVDRMIKNIP